MPFVPAGLEFSCNLAKTDVWFRPGHLQDAMVKNIYYDLVRTVTYGTLIVSPRNNTHLCFINVKQDK